MIKYLVGFSVVVLTLISCEQTYQCACSVDAPDSLSLGLPLSFDTTFQVTGRIEEEAQIKCEGFENAQSLLGIQVSIPGLDEIQVDCELE